MFTRGLLTQPIHEQIEEKNMPDTARPRKKNVAPSDKAKRERINARRRLRYAERRRERTRAAAVAANATVEEANCTLLTLLGELKLSMKAVEKQNRVRS